MKFAFPASAALLLLSFIACNDSALRRSTSDVDLKTLNNVAPEDINQLADSATGITQDPKQGPVTANQASQNEDWEKKIIKNGTINLEVKDYSKYYQLLREIVKREGGYIAQEDQQQSEYKLENTIILKVPVSRFEETMELIAGGTGNEEVKEKKITSADVTGEVVDTKSRIEAKKEVRLRYLELLKQAKTMNDILQVQQEINGIQEQMEMASGRVNYLNHASALSTINLTFYQVLNAAASDKKEPSFAIKIFSAFLSGWQFVKAIIVGLISIWPLWFLVFGLWLAFRRWKGVKPKSI